MAPRVSTLPIQPQIPEISVGTSNRMDHLGLIRPEYLGAALKVVHFDRSGYLGRSDRNVSFHLTKLLSPVPLFRILLTRTITKYRSIEHVEFPKFQNRIFVEWKAPHVYPYLICRGSRWVSQ